MSTNFDHVNNKHNTVSKNGGRGGHGGQFI